jgi:hypothetical protein
MENELRIPIGKAKYCNVEVFIFKIDFESIVDPSSLENKNMVDFPLTQP